jgi:hypothetical protein
LLPSQKARSKAVLIRAQQLLHHVPPFAAKHSSPCPPALHSRYTPAGSPPWPCSPLQPWRSWREWAPSGSTRRSRRRRRNCRRCQVRLGMGGQRYADRSAAWSAWLCIAVHVNVWKEAGRKEASSIYEPHVILILQCIARRTTAPGATPGRPNKFSTTSELAVG